MKFSPTHLAGGRATFDIYFLPLMAPPYKQATSYKQAEPNRASSYLLL